MDWMMTVDGGGGRIDSSFIFASQKPKQTKNGHSEIFRTVAKGNAAKIPGPGLLYYETPRC